MDDAQPAHPTETVRDLELHAAIHALVDQAATAARRSHGHGPLPGVGTDDWWRAPGDVQLAALLVLAEAWLIADPERAAAQRLKTAAEDLAAATDWAARASNHVPHTELAARRAQPGPLASTGEKAS